MRKSLASITALAVLTSPVFALAAVAFDNSDKLTASVASGATATISNFTVAATNPSIIVFTAIGAGTDADTSCTYNGIAMNKIISLNAGQKNNAFWLTGNSGTHDVVCTNNSASTRQLEIGVQSYTGAFQTPVYAPIGGQTDATTTNSTTASTITKAITTITDNSWVATSCIDDTTGASPTANTNITVRQSNTEQAIGDSNAAVTPAGSFSQTWNSSNGGANVLGMMQVTVSPAAAAVASPPDDGDMIMYQG